MTEVQNNKKIVDRSPAYPSIDLKSAVDLSSRLFDLFSDYDFSREVATEKLGIGKNSNSFRKIAALVQYGLLKRKGNSYVITTLAKEIVLATDEPTKIKLLGKAAHQPKIYSRLITENAGKGLPTSLDVRLRQLDYSKEAVKTLVVLFRHSLEYAGLLKNGIVVNSAEETVPQNAEGALSESIIASGQTSESGNVPPSSEQGGSKPVIPSPGTNLSGIPYPLDCGIVVTFPISMLKKLATGVFLAKLNELEELGKEGNETPKHNAPDAPVEPDKTTP